MATLRETTAALETVRGLPHGRAVYLARELQSRAMLPLGPQGGGQHAHPDSPSGTAKKFQAIQEARDACLLVAENRAA